MNLLRELGHSGLSLDFTDKTNHEENMKAVSLDDKIMFAELVRPRLCQMLTDNVKNVEELSS
jgi:hypothetical protein